MPNEPDSRTQDKLAETQSDSDLVDDRSAAAKGIDIATRITTMSITMVLPALGGYFLDQKLGTSPLFIIVGTAFGMASGFWLLMKLVRTLNPNE